MKKMAFIDLTNYNDWPMGGMLEYELAILPYICEHYDVDLWGFSVNGVPPAPLVINGKKYPVNIAGNCTTKRKLVPNYWRGLNLMKFGKQFYDKYDIIYSHTGSCMTAISRIVNREHTKLVYHQHGLNYLTDKSLFTKIQKPFFKWAQKASHLVFVVSDYDSVKVYSEKQQRFSKAKYVAVSSPINLEKFNLATIKKRIEDHKDKNTSIFIYTGRFTPYKNAKLLVEAMSLYCKRINPDAILRLVGSGEELDIIRNLRKELDIEKNIQIYGAVPHIKIYELLNSSDVFLTASGGEGCSVSVLEAYASGLPVICGKVRGLEKQVVDGYTGYFVDDFTPESFYKKMVLLDKNRAKLSANCLEHAKKYDAATISKQIIDEIDSLMQDSSI